MKPHRLSLTHSLVLNYGLYQKMEVILMFLIGQFVIVYIPIRYIVHTVPLYTTCVDSILRIISTFYKGECVCFVPSCCC